MKGKATIQMVAERAGVSRGTVDRVLNGRPHVNEEARRKVLEAAEALGYVPLSQRRQEEGPAGLTLGILLPNWEGQFRAEAARGIRLARAELEESGVRVELRRCETDGEAEALGHLEELWAAGAAGFAVCAVDGPSVSAWVSARVEEGIPCVTFNSDLPESGRLNFVGQDVRKAGRVAAGLMYKCVSGRGPVLAAAGNLKFHAHRQRLEGFRERLEELGFPMEDLVVRETFNDYGRTLEAVSQTLEALPELQGVYMANFSVAACCDAISRAGRTGRVHVLCHDINDGIRQLLRAGAVDFTIPQDLESQGCVPLLLLRDYLRKKSPPMVPVSGHIGILCPENLD